MQLDCCKQWHPHYVMRHCMVGMHRGQKCDHSLWLCIHYVKQHHGYICTLSKPYRTPSKANVRCTALISAAEDTFVAYQWSVTETASCWWAVLGYRLSAAVHLPGALRCWNTFSALCSGLGPKCGFDWRINTTKLADIGGIMALMLAGKLPIIYSLKIKGGEGKKTCDVIFGKKQLGSENFLHDRPARSIFPPPVSRH